MPKSKDFSSKDSSIKKIFEIVKNDEIKFIDFRFTDYTGKWLHISYSAEEVSEEELTKGVAFDGSSVAGWKAIHESDMLMIPDLETAFIDPFLVAPTLSFFCQLTLYLNY